MLAVIVLLRCNNHEVFDSDRSLLELDYTSQESVRLSNWTVRAGEDG